MPEQPPAGPSTPAAGAGQPAPGAAPRKSKWRRWLIRGAITVAGIVILSAVLVAAAEHETAKPQFCASCHIMTPYYESWQKDIHGGKLEVACVECHYAPGERTTIKAHLRGLSQVASYVSGRYGSSRPRPHVDNQSCLTSKCHGDNAFMDKEIALTDTVKFVHAKHLRSNGPEHEALAKRLKNLTGSLRKRIDAEHLEKLQQIAQECVPAQERNQRMAALVNEVGAKIDQRELTELAQYYHMDLRLSQLTNLQCTNCHSYGGPDRATRLVGLGDLAPPSHHFSVKTTACFTCHFTNEDFNTGTGACLKCHTLPNKAIPVHPELTPEESAKLKTPELARKPVQMNHQAILQRKVDCVACHADVARENSTVTRRDCQHCHDQPEFFKDWQQPISLDLAKKYHALHVPGERAKCLDCHSQIHHQLARGNGAHGEPRFLATVMADCAACHPNHHAAQVELLSGTGGVGVPKGDPNMMFGMRTNCLGCHTSHVTMTPGGTTVRAAVGGCIACHGERYAQTFKQWQEGLQSSLSDAAEAYDKASKALASAKDIPPQVRTTVTAKLAGARADLQLVKTGHGVHNVMYSLQLLDSVTQRCQEVAATLAKEGKRKP